MTMGMLVSMSTRYEVISLLFAVMAVFAWSSITPYDRLTWVMEVLPAVIACTIMAATYRTFPLTRLLYWLIAIHCIILIVGGHYTYARVPAGDWLRDALDLSRNHYDRLGHFVQGFVPAMVARELLVRTSPLRPGKWMFVLVTLGCLGISAAYELIEFAAAVLTGDAAENFLGTQGDVWDTQKDMLLAGIGAATAQLLLGRIHDRQLQALRAA